MTRKKSVSLALVVIFAAGMTSLWRWTTLADWFSIVSLTAWAGEFKSSPLAPFWVLTAFVIAAQIFFPITVMSLASVLAFGPVAGTLYSTVGVILGGIATYFIGRTLGEARLCSLAGPRVQKLRGEIVQHGLATSVTIHILPVAPFTLVNLFSGASGLRLRDFVIGTFIGHLPGALYSVIFHNQLRRVIRSPDPLNITLLVLVVAALGVAAWWLHAHHRKTRSNGANQ
jgi:uncharacterized membrane protein YdjX (TVP38/TMEM64 family)